MLEIINSTVLITRRCDLRCSYCKIVQSDFPELSIEAWEDVFSILHDELKSGFNIILGGEPLCLGDDLVRLVKYLNSKDIPYAITSNSVSMTDEMFNKLIDAGVRNWSVSIDSWPGGPDPLDKHVGKKSNAGFELLGKLKEAGVPDLHATIVATRNNYKSIPDFVRIMNAMGVWSEITTVEWAKSALYDFSAPLSVVDDVRFKLDDMEYVQTIANELVDLKNQGMKIHNDTEWFKEWPRYTIDIDWKCSKLCTLTVDADGSIRTCLRMAGDLPKKYNIFDLVKTSVQEQFEEDWHRERKRCKGCFWDCQFQAESWSNDPEKGKKIFQHRG